MKVLLLNGSPHKNGETYKALSIIEESLKEKGIDIREALDRKPWIVRWAVYGALIVAIPVFGRVSNTIGGFMYAQF